MKKKLLLKDNPISSAQKWTDRSPFEGTGARALLLLAKGHERWGRQRILGRAKWKRREGAMDGISNNPLLPSKSRRQTNRANLPAPSMRPISGKRRHFALMEAFI
jgi:hypothetical protein